MKYSKTISLDSLVHEFIANNQHIVREEDYTNFTVLYDEGTDKIEVRLNFEEPE